MSFLTSLFSRGVSTVVNKPVENNNDSDDNLSDSSDNSSNVKSSNEFVVGENGTLEYSSTAISDKLLAMFFKMVRNTSEEDVKILFDANITMMTNASLSERIVMATNLFILCFLVRNCRGGKGEKNLFYVTFELLAIHFPETIHATLLLIPLFGSWKDVFVLIERNKLSIATVKKLLDLVANQLKKETDEQHYTLLAKWMPREGKALYNNVTKVLSEHGMKTLAYEIMTRYTTVAAKNVRKEYRKLIVNISSKLDLVETHMCDGTWSKIEFGKVPSLAISQYAHAFDLTEQKKVHHDRDEPNEDRVLCKEHYIAHLVDGKVNGSQVNIDKLVESVFNVYRNVDVDLPSLISRGPYDLLLAHRQFESYVEFVQKQLDDASKEARENINDKFTFSPSDCEVMIDVSGSMQGQPMYAAIGIGMLIMALQKKEKPDNKSSFLTFHDQPSFVDITDCTSFPETVSCIHSAPWGGHTNFVKAFDLMLQKSGNNIANAKKTLVVLSDMQFDNALGQYSKSKAVNCWELMYETICQIWKDWYNVNDDNLPTIVFWNLRGDTAGHPVKSDTKGVVEISGYSASLFKMVLFGEELSQTVDPETLDPETKPTPSQILARTLAAKEYDCVKEALGWKEDKLGECIFKNECEALSI